jgi:hypothetical protein
MRFENNPLSKLGSLFILSSILMGCSMGSKAAIIPEATATAGPTATSTPPAEPITQWAGFARASSQWSDTDASAKMATGSKSLSICEDSSGAWASSTSIGVEWLDVFFKQPVVPTELSVYLNYNPEGLQRVEMIDTKGNYHEVFSGGFQSNDCPDVLKITIEEAEYQAVGARVWIDQTALQDWTEVDAVQVTGFAEGPALTTMPPVPTPTFAPAAQIGERSFYDRPDDQPGQYQFHVIYALFKDQDDYERDLDNSIAKSIKLANGWFDEQSGGSTLRFDTYQGELDVTFVQFDKTAREVRDIFQSTYDKDHKTYPFIVIEDYYMDWIDAEIRRLNLVARGKYYIVYLESSHPRACGYSQVSNHLGLFFLRTDYCGYGRLGVDAYAWENEFVLLHEVLHGIGFIPACALHSIPDNTNHVDDSPKDLMYPYVGRGEKAILDVGNDDYFNHSNGASCADLADSVFLEPLPANPVAPEWPEVYLLD